MPAYLIADVEVVDRDAFVQYGKAVPATIAAYGGRYLARGGAIEVLEGTWEPKRCVILEFPSMVQLKTWYQSADYLPLLELRKRCTHSKLIVTEGL